MLPYSGGDYALRGYIFRNINSISCMQVFTVYIVGRICGQYTAFPIIGMNKLNMHLR